MSDAAPLPTQWALVIETRRGQDIVHDKFTSLGAANAAAERLRALYVRCFVDVASPLDVVGLRRPSA